MRKYVEVTAILTGVLCFALATPAEAVDQQSV
jgi:hypothetical protein